MRCSGIRMRRMRQQHDLDHPASLLLLRIRSLRWWLRMRLRLRQQLYLDHSPSLLLRRMGKWMRFRLLTEPASQETAGRLTAALSVRSLCIFSFLRPVFLFSPLALLIDLVDSISIYDKSSHFFPSGFRIPCRPKAVSGRSHLPERFRNLYFSACGCSGPSPASLYSKIHRVLP